MSFKRHWEIYPNERGADQKADALIAHSDEFPSWLFLDRLLSSIARLRFTSRSPLCFASSPTQGTLSTECVTHVSEHVLPMSKVQTLRERDLAIVTFGVRTCSHQIYGPQQGVSRRHGRRG